MLSAQPAISCAVSSRQPQSATRRRSKLSALPNTFVVGAAKSGTTALYYYLKSHPQAFVPEAVKESNYMAFYDGLPPLRGPGDSKVARFSVTRWNDYRNLFCGGAGQRVAVDISPSYLYFPQAAPKIRELCPNAKIVIVLRNPVECAFSMYCMMRRDRREPCHSFRRSFHLSAWRLNAGWQWFWDLQSGWRYSAQIRRYLDLFSARQLFIRRYEVMQNQPEEFYRDLVTFLGIDPIDTSQANRRVNAAPRRGEMLAKRRLGRLALSHCEDGGLVLAASAEGEYSTESAESACLRALPSGPPHVDRSFRQRHSRTRADALLGLE